MSPTPESVGSGIIANEEQIEQNLSAVVARFYTAVSVLRQNFPPTPPTVDEINESLGGAESEASWRIVGLVTDFSSMSEDCCVHPLVRSGEGPLYALAGADFSEAYVAYHETSHLPNETVVHWGGAAGRLRYVQVGSQLWSHLCLRVGRSLFCQPEESFLQFLKRVMHDNQADSDERLRASRFLLDGVMKASAAK